LKSLENRNLRSFALIWFAHLVSVIGSQISGFGLASWVFLQTHHTQDYANIGLAASLPMAILAPFVGVLVDRWHRRTSLLVAEGVGGLISLLLFLIARFGHLLIWQIFVCTLVQTAAIAFTWPALSAITSVMVPRKHLARATAMLSFTDAAAMLLGPSLGGIMLPTGLSGLLFADLASFIIAVVILNFFVQIPAIPRMPMQPGKNTMLGEIWFSLRYVWERPGLFRLLVFFLFSNSLRVLGKTLVAPLLLTLYPTALAGAIQGLEGVGIIAGTVWVMVLSAPSNRAKGTVWFNNLSALTLFAMALPPFPLFYSAAYFGMALFGNLGYTCNQSLWQAKVDPAIQGRVFSIRRMIAQMGTPIALLMAGPLADRVFAPAMAPGGPLVPWLGGIFGDSAGAGVRVLVCLLGIVAAINSWMVWRSSHVRNVETELPDFDAVPAEA
jgi:MFS family permease